jgi:WD40 repeat protein
VRQQLTDRTQRLLSQTPITPSNVELVQPLRMLNVSENEVSGLAFSPNKPLFVSVGWIQKGWFKSPDYMVRVWQMGSWETVFTLEGLTISPSGWRFRPTGSCW